MYSRRQAADFCGRSRAHIKGLASSAGVGAHESNSRIHLASGEPNAPALTVMPSGLLVAYVVDEGDQLAYVQHRHLDAAEMSTDELARLGFNNLTEAASRIEVQQRGPIYTVGLDGWSEASLLLVDSLWQATLSEFTPGGAMAVIPTRDVLAFCDAKATDGVDTLGEVVRRLAGAEHGITNLSFSRLDSGWFPMRVTTNS